MTQQRSAPKPKDDTYSAEEVAKRMEAAVRAMIAMKPQPRTRSTKPKTDRKSKYKAE